MSLHKDDLTRFRGVALTPTDDGYDDARRIFNDRLAGRPALIAKCAGVADVQEALRLARSEGVALSVRGGGHGLAGWASNDDGMVIDLTRMRWVLVDPSARTAWIGGGAQAGDVVSETIGHGLVPVTGVVPSIGLGGIATGAGEGYLTPQYGYASDNVLAFELVTAAGEVLRVSATDHPDLFWGMRGAGPNFGVITAMHLRLHPAPERTVGGAISFSAEDAPRVLEQVWELMEHGSPYFFPQAGFIGGADGTFKLDVMPGHVGPADIAEREIAQIRDVATPVSDTTSTMSYVELLHTMVSEYESESGGDANADPWAGVRNMWDIIHLPFTGPRARQIELVLAQAARLGPHVLFDLWRTMPGDAGAAPSAVPRDPGIAVAICGVWQDPADDAAGLDRTVDITRQMLDSGLVTESPSASNHVTVPDRQRVIENYGVEGYARLQRLKATYDPDNLFRRNYNIPPDRDRGTSPETNGGRT